MNQRKITLEMTLDETTWLVMALTLASGIYRQLGNRSFQEWTEGMAKKLTAEAMAAQEEAAQ